MFATFRKRWVLIGSPKAKFEGKGMGKEEIKGTFT